MILGRLIIKVTAITAMISQAKRVTAVSLSSGELLYTLKHKCQQNNNCEN